MPCVSDYMEPNEKESLLQETAQLLIYVRMNTNSGVKISSRLKAAARDIYCRKDYVPELCDAISSMTEEEQARIVYDGRNPEARRLADWWDKHEEADRKRLEEEHRRELRNDLRRKALAKLTPEEIEALLNK
jgi:hypothetical protein